MFTPVSFLIPMNIIPTNVHQYPQTESIIMTQPNTILDDCEINSQNEVRVYGITKSPLEELKTEPHKIVCITTGQTIDDSGYELKKLGHVKRTNDFVFHIFEVMN